MSSVSSGVTTHSGKTNVLSRHSFVLYQPTNLPAVHISALQDEQCAADQANELLVLRPEESFGVFTVSLRQILVLLLNSGVYCESGGQL